MEEATASLFGFFNGMIGFVLWGKCVTEWNEQNSIDAWSGLSRCIVALALFCNFSHKIICSGMHLPIHGKQ